MTSRFINKQIKIPPSLLSSSHYLDSKSLCRKTDNFAWTFTFRPQTVSCQGAAGNSDQHVCYCRLQDLITKSEHGELITTATARSVSHVRNLKGQYFLFFPCFGMSHGKFLQRKCLCLNITFRNSHHKLVLLSSSKDCRRTMHSFFKSKISSVIILFLGLLWFRACCLVTCSHFTTAY
jgi:hypothetical protein